jgi:predicted RNase H-like nuclease (RuvC/YqgF family)
MQYPKRLTLAAAVLAAILGSTAAHANTYRYTDENGQMVISNTVPQEAVKRGYQILNQQGRVIREVAPALTEEEIAAREARKREEQRLEEQRKQDAMLLKRFSSPDSAVKAMHRKIEELESLIQLKQGNISVLESQLQNEQSRAADMERQGREVLQGVLQKISRLEQQIGELEAEIADQRSDIDAARQEFLEDIRRLEQITDKERTLPLNRKQSEAVGSDNEQ